METQTKSSLYQKLHAVMKDMDGVPKNGTHSQKWTFIRADDMFNRARQSFIEHGLIVIPGVLPETVQQRDGDKNKYDTTMIRTTIVFTYTFIDIETGDQFVTSWPGESSDYSDKGIQQAGTSAMKYMLMKMFMATPDHDPDYNTGEQPAQATQQTTTTNPPQEPNTAPAATTSDKTVVRNEPVTFNHAAELFDGMGAGASTAFWGAIAHLGWKPGHHKMNTLNSMWDKGELKPGMTMDAAKDAVIKHMTDKGNA